MSGHSCVAGHQDVRDVWRPPTGAYGLLDQADDSLRRLRRTFLREASDLAEGGYLDRARRASDEAQLIRRHQMARFRLRMRYGAVDDHLGTPNFDCWYRHDAAPTYRLAAAMDRARQWQGRSHVLEWPTEVAWTG